MKPIKPSVPADENPIPKPKTLKPGEHLNPGPMIKLIEIMYPQMKPAPSMEFNGRGGGIWFKGSESAELGGLRIFDYWANDPEELNYQLHVLKSFRELLNDYGWFPQPHDAGTLMAWPL